jgi:hypothetical protein
MIKSRFHLRHAQILLLERHLSKLLQHLYHVPHRQRNVLLLQHGKGR